ncbi:hypothetical protein [Streptomyces sp. NPDC005752]
MSSPHSSRTARSAPTPSGTALATSGQRLLRPRRAAWGSPGWLGI